MSDKIRNVTAFVKAYIKSKSGEYVLTKPARRQKDHSYKHNPFAEAFRKAVQK